MQLPVDIRKLIDEATAIDEALTTPLEVSIYVDNEAPVDLIAHIRNAFASSLSTVRLTLVYLESRTFAPNPKDDMAVIVAGLSRAVGPCAQAIRAAGVPVMIATTLPSLVAQIAQAVSSPLPKEDIVAPRGAENGDEQGQACMVCRAMGRFTKWLAHDSYSLSSSKSFNRLTSDTFQTSTEDASKTEPMPPLYSNEEPYLLTSENAAALDERMGQWVIDACPEKRLAFSLAFSFVRRPLALDAIGATSLQNAAVGLIPLLPGADLPIMTLNQAKMTLQIAAAYGQPMSKDRVKEIVAVVGNAFAWRQVARSLLKAVPVLGGPVRAGVGYTGTLALGRALIAYFEGGGNVSGVAHVISRVWDAGEQLADSVWSNQSTPTTSNN